ncbi:hypothetical protein GE21DRAFT_5056 [Neurospora crassa]|nr:hypothetical protein GE21DRAFT_5056 [Neurospora crassa]
METNKSSGSRRPAENADQSPSEVQYVEHHTPPGRAANNGYGFKNDLTPNSSDVPDPGPSDTVMTDVEYSAIHERLLQEPLTPGELQAIENGALPGTYEELVAHSSQFPNIHEMFNRIVIDHDRGYENISVSSMSTASASHQAVVAPEALGPATLGHLSQSVASSAGHSIARSSTSNQSPRRVQVGPPIVSQETCNGPHGRGGCMALV